MVRTPPTPTPAAWFQGSICGSNYAPSQGAGHPYWTATTQERSLAGRRAQPPLAPSLRTAGAPALPHAVSCSSLLSRLQLFLRLSSVPVPHRTLDRVRRLGCGWGLCSAGREREKRFPANSPYQNSCVSRRRPEATGPRGETGEKEGTALGFESCRGREGTHQRGPERFS